MTKLVHYIVIVVVFVVSAIGAETMAVGEMRDRELRGSVMDAASGLPVAGAVVVDDRGGWAVADTLGAFVLDISHDGAIGLTISSLGYHTLKTSPRDDGTYRLMVDVYALDEVVVTATEGRVLPACRT